jgi:hypothetical protein
MDERIVTSDSPESDHDCDSDSDSPFTEESVAPPSPATAYARRLLLRKTSLAGQMVLPSGKRSLPHHALRENKINKRHRVQDIQSAVEARLFDGKATDVHGFGSMEDWNENEPTGFEENVEIDSGELQKLILSIPLEDQDGEDGDITKTLMVCYY